MRMAIGRGQSHFNVSDFLQPFVENEDMISYKLENMSASNAYYHNSDPSMMNGVARDENSFLPACDYSNRNINMNLTCNLFEPTVTDLGMCYSFNAEPLEIMLENSTFTKAFHEVYQYDILNYPIKKALGPGDNFALRFMVDNSQYLRKASQTHPFKVLISSQKGYFDALSIAKEIKPGFETTYHVQPFEVHGTSELRKIPEEIRKCKFPDEVDRKDSMFKIYSQTSCEFECRINDARKKCKCTPWNFPTPPSLTNPTICDLYGTYCFKSQLTNPISIHNCLEHQCLSDCSEVRFSINEKEVPINVDEHCEYSQYQHLDGYDLVFEKLRLQKNHGNFPLFYQYHKMAQLEAVNSTADLPDTIYKQVVKECREIMRNDIAIVKVRFESSKYIKAIMDKRLSFPDKLSSFGKILDFTLNTVHFKKPFKYFSNVICIFSNMIGGTLGLFTGMSILSMAEFVFWMIKIVIVFLKPLVKSIRVGCSKLLGRSTRVDDSAEDQNSCA